MANPFLRQAMPAHMTDAELDLMEKKLKKGAAVDEIMKMMQRKRREKGLLGPSRPRSTDSSKVLRMRETLRTIEAVPPLCRPRS